MYPPLTDHAWKEAGDWGRVKTGERSSLATVYGASDAFQGKSKGKSGGGGRGGQLLRMLAAEAVTEESRPYRMDWSMGGEAKIRPGRQKSVKTKQTNKKPATATC